MKRFTMQDLKSGHRVENRMGVRYIVLKDAYTNVLLFSTGCYNSTEYNKDLLNRYPDQDIMKVFSPVHVADTLDLNAKVELIWERPTYTELFDALEVNK